jgi:hypothetical protein
MTANRKAKTKKTSTTLPEEHIEIPKVEQWRLINDTGILKQPIPSPRPTLASEDQEDTQLGAQIFNSIILIIPFSFLLLMMEM